MSKLPPICNTNPSFKGWTKPGPLPADDPDVGLEPNERIDALCGHFRIWQLKDGHRFSTDDVLTAWYGTSWAASVGNVLDLGSGIGSVAMTAAWRLPGARFTTVEAQDISIALARKSVRYNGLEDRFDLRLGDFRDEGVLSPDERFDLVLGSPPYFPLGTGVEGDHPQKVACRFEVRGDISHYCETAAKHLAPGGWFACVFPIDPDAQKQRVFDAARAADLTVVRWRPVALKGPRPYLGLFAMQRSQDLPEEYRDQTFEEPVLTVRREDGTLDPEYAAVKMSFGFPPGG